MKYYLIAGEASGDLHASNLMRELKTVDPEAQFRFFGGDLMQAEGGDLVMHYRNMAFMGIMPVVMNLRTIFRNMELCRRDIADYSPDMVILVDYPGFNLKIAKYVKTQLHIPVYYYISPKIWAWKEYRIRSIRRYVDRMFCILPFEVEFYNGHRFPVEYVGNPTVDSVAAEPQGDTFDTFISENQLADKPIIALLAGSRRQEIKDNLPTMFEAAAAFTDYQLVIAGAPGIDPAYYKDYIGNHRVNIVFGQTYRLLRHSRLALVTSGTATLETALFRVPQVVCYRMPGGALVNFVWDHFFKVDYISLVNLIANREVVKELFGKYFSAEQIRAEATSLLYDEAYRNRMLAGYDEVIRRLGQPGASRQAAEKIVEVYTQRKNKVDLEK